MSANRPEQWCKKLRWKGYDVDQENLARVAEVFEHGGVIFTCLTTAQPFGEDDNIAAPEACVSGRGCYVQHPRLRLLSV
ncbi:MAG: hypothetical protein AB2A00_31770 [Myxococcota bacterium]